jgi:hypothetical protein
MRARTRVGESGVSGVEEVEAVRREAAVEEVEEGLAVRAPVRVLAVALIEHCRVAARAFLAQLAGEAGDVFGEAEDVLGTDEHLHPGRAAPREAKALGEGARRLQRGIVLDRVASHGDGAEAGGDAFEERRFAAAVLADEKRDGRGELDALQRRDRRHGPWEPILRGNVVPAVDRLKVHAAFLALSGRGGHGDSRCHARSPFATIPPGGALGARKSLVRA